MDEQIIFQNYARADLDAQYDNRAAVPEHVAYHHQWDQESEAARQSMGCRLDIAYGPSGAETLDIFPTEGSSPTAAPVQVFFHGGYWFSRDIKDFSFLAKTVAPSGAVLVLVNYALLPAVEMDELVRQCRASLAWVYGNIASYGGDRNRIFISGHSAGGHIAAMMMTTDWSQFPGAPSNLIKGVTAVSGIYDLEPVRLCFINETLGLTPDQARRNSPIHLTPPPDMPLILAAGGNETDEFQRQTTDHAAAWGERMTDCTLIMRPGHDHFTILDDLADGNGPLMQAMRAQMGLA